MATQKLYQETSYQKEVSSILAEISENNGVTELIFMETVCFPGGGGQSCDLGTIRAKDGTSYAIIETKERGEDVVHIIDGCGHPFTAGEEYDIILDWDRRFDNMQRHSGEHVLTGAFIKVTGGANKGFHMGDDYITIDMDLNGEQLTEEQIRRAEYLANEAIWNNVPFQVSWFEDKESAAVMPVRKALDSLKGRVSIVTIGSVEDPFDCVACCGTHVASAAEVGQIKIWKVESNRGMNRVYFDCGKRAFERVQRDMAVLQTIEEQYSAGSDDLLDKINRKEAKVSELHADYAKLTQYVRSQEALRIHKAIETAPTTLHVEPMSLLNADDLVKLGFAAIEGIEKPVLLALIHEPTHTVLLSSGGTDAPNCGALVKEHAKAFGGRGGGRPDNARALFADTDSVNNFLEALTKEF